MASTEPYAAPSTDPFAVPKPEQPLAYSEPPRQPVVPYTSAPQTGPQYAQQYPQQQQYPQYYAPAPYSAPAQINNQVIAGGGYDGRRRCPHGLHAILTLLTAGLWAPVWIIDALISGRR